MLTYTGKQKGKITSRRGCFCWRLLKDALIDHTTEHATFLVCFLLKNNDSGLVKRENAAVMHIKLSLNGLQRNSSSLFADSDSKLAKAKHATTKSY